VFLVRFAVRCGIRDLRPAESQVLHPPLGSFTRVAAAEVLEAPAVMDPFCRHERREPLLPGLRPRDPAIRVQRGLCGRQRRHSKHLSRRQTNRFSLSDDEIEMAILRVFVFDHFFVLVREDLLLDGHLRTSR